MKDNMKTANFPLSFSIVKHNDSNCFSAISEDDCATVLAIVNRLCPVLEQENIYYDKETQCYYKSFVSEGITENSSVVTFFDVTDIQTLVNIYKEKSDFLKIDETTGITVKREFYYLMQDYIKNQAYPFNEEFSILAFDLDNFKKVNDIYGHHQGDLTLKLVANTLKENIKKTDIIGRIGGEEFAVLLKNVDKNNSFKKAEQLRELVASCDYEVPITTSIGIIHSSDIPDHRLDSEAIDGTLCAYYIDLADKALYKSKSDGKNCTNFYQRSNCK